MKDLILFLLSFLPLVDRRDPSMRPSRTDEDNGTPLTDEISDLVRCAATCWRWCRQQVSGEAAFICRISRRLPGPSGRFLPSLAIGFFHQKDAAAPCFVPTAHGFGVAPIPRPP
jgi:hypothetical protein